MDLTDIESTRLAGTTRSMKTRGNQQGAALIKRTTEYVELDVHKSTTLASVCDEGGRVFSRSIVPTEEPAIVEFFSGMRGSIHVVFEEGTQAQCCTIS